MGGRSDQTAHRGLGRVVPSPHHRQRLGAIGPGRWQFDSWWLAASGGLYLLGTLCCGVFWHRTLRALGQPVSLPQALRAYYIGQLGKYVPGKAMVVILRAGLVRGQGSIPALAAVSVFLETLTMMSSRRTDGSHHRGRSGSAGSRCCFGPRWA